MDEGFKISEKFLIFLYLKKSDGILNCIILKISERHPFEACQHYSHGKALAP
jgi:hypothetical protein